MNRGDIAQSIHTQKQADVLNKNYKKDYENEKINYEFQKTLADVPGESSRRTFPDFPYSARKITLFNTVLIFKLYE